MCPHLSQGVHVPQPVSSQVQICHNVHVALPVSFQPDCLSFTQQRPHMHVAILWAPWDSTDSVYDSHQRVLGPTQSANVSLGTGPTWARGDWRHCISSAALTTWSPAWRQYSMPAGRKLGWRCNGQGKRLVQATDKLYSTSTCHWSPGLSAHPHDDEIWPQVCVSTGCHIIFVHSALLLDTGYQAMYLMDTSCSTGT
jgi:hypothetical protein